MSQMIGYFAAHEHRRSMTHLVIGDKLACRQRRPRGEFQFCAFRQQTVLGPECRRCRTIWAGGADATPEQEQR